MALKILVVDDNKGDQILLKEAISQTNLECQLVYAADGHEATRLAAVEKPDLILMDIMMPVLSGGDAVKLIRQNLKNAHIPIIFLSGIVTSMEEGVDKGITIKGEKFWSLAKPVNPQKLLEMISMLIVKH